MSVEQWKPVPGYEGLYEVSDQGRVRRAPQILNPNRNVHGYARVQLSTKGVVKGELVHQLVLRAFVGARPEGAEARHLDGNPQNNSLSNLKWGTHQENVDDKIAHGTTNQGERNPSRKLNAVQVLQIFKSDESNKTLAVQYAVSESTIEFVKNGRNWSHITGKQYKRRRA